jgi:hypothetical protein
MEYMALLASVGADGGSKLPANTAGVKAIKLMSLSDVVVVINNLLESYKKYGNLNFFSFPRARGQR